MLWHLCWAGGKACGGGGADGSNVDNSGCGGGAVGGVPNVNSSGDNGSTVEHSSRQGILLLSLTLLCLVPQPTC